jgi:hypothetical protein
LADLWGEGESVGESNFHQIPQAFVGIAAILFGLAIYCQIKCLCLIIKWEDMDLCNCSTERRGKG